MALLASDGSPMQGAPGAQATDGGPASSASGDDAAEVLAKPAGRGISRVLYVDDEPGLCRAFARLFRDDARLTVETLSTPVEAATLIESQLYDVVVSDLRMPGMSGIELLAIARKTMPDARRLLVSGYADFQAALEAINEIGV